MRWIYAMLLILTSCGGSTESTGGNAGAGGTGALPSCVMCRATTWVCNPGNGLESQNFRVDNRTENGCSGKFLSPGNTDMGHMDVTCSPPQKCDSTGCADVTLTDTSMKWGTATCWAQ